MWLKGACYESQKTILWSLFLLLLIKSQSFYRSLVSQGQRPNIFSYYKYSFNSFTHFQHYLLFFSSPITPFNITFPWQHPHVAIFYLCIIGHCSWAMVKLMNRIKKYFSPLLTSYPIKLWRHHRKLIISISKYL